MLYSFKSFHYISISLIYNEYCKKIHFNNNFFVKCMKKPSSHFVPSYVSNCATLRTTLYSRDIFLVPLARMASLFLNEKWLFDFLHRGKIRYRRLEGSFVERLAAAVSLITGR